MEDRVWMKSLRLDTKNKRFLKIDANFDIEVIIQKIQSQLLKLKLVF